MIFYYFSNLNYQLIFKSSLIFRYIRDKGELIKLNWGLYYGWNEDNKNFRCENT